MPARRPHQRPPWRKNTSHVSEQQSQLIVANFRHAVRDSLVVHKVRPTLCYMHPETYMGFTDAIFQSQGRFMQVGTGRMEFEGVRLVLVHSMPVDILRFQ